jgi:hypothetical protein
MTNNPNGDMAEAAFLGGGNDQALKDGSVEEKGVPGR